MSKWRSFYSGIVFCLPKVIAVIDNHDYDDIDSIRGLDIAINTTSSTDEECYWLLKEFGFPLRERPVKNPSEKELA